jgi:hypothetical protein
MAEPEFVLQLHTARMSIRPYKPEDEDTNALIRAIADGVKSAGGTVTVVTTTVEERPF